MKRNVAALFAWLVMICAPGAYAVGIADSGQYKVWAGERTPAEVFDNIRIIPPPMGGPLKVSVRTDKARYHVGDPIKILFGVNRDAYVYIFNTDAAGMTTQIFPNYYDPSNFLRSGKTYFIPDRGYDIEILPPAGNATLSIVATERDWPFLEEYRRYTRQDPYPAHREGATALVRRIEHFRVEPSAMSMSVLRPAPRENLWANESTTYYVMDRYRVPPTQYEVPTHGWLEVDTYPSNARIYIDADYYGRSPQVVDRLEIGYHRVRLEKEGYQPYECNVYIKGNESKHLDIFLKQTPIEPGYSRSENPGKKGGFGFFQ